MPAWLSSSRNASARGEVRDASDLWLLTQVWAFAALVPLLMRDALPGLIARITPTDPPAADHRRAYQATVFVHAFMRRLGRRAPNPCLHRSLTLYHFLRRFGVPVTLHFGMDAHRRVGHAWVALHGAPLFEPREPTEAYLEMLHFPAPDVAPRATRGTGVRA